MKGLGGGAPAHFYNTYETTIKWCSDCERALFTVFPKTERPLSSRRQALTALHHTDAYAKLALEHLNARGVDLTYEWNPYFHNLPPEEAKRAQPNLLANHAVDIAANAATLVDRSQGTTYIAALHSILDRFAPRSFPHAIALSLQNAILYNSRDSLTTILASSSLHNALSRNTHFACDAVAYLILNGLADGPSTG